MEDHKDVPDQSAKDLWEPEALVVLPPTHCLGLQLEPPSGCPNMKYCLDMHVTLMEELRAIPSPLTLGWTPCGGYAAQC